MPRALTTFPMNQFGASRISRQWPGSTVISGKNIKAKQHHGIASAARVGGFGSELGLNPVVLAPSRHAEYEHHPPQKWKKLMKAPVSQAHMPYNNWVGIFVLLSKT